jgi:hypothetical protein
MYENKTYKIFKCLGFCGGLGFDEGNLQGGDSLFHVAIQLLTIGTYTMCPAVHLITQSTAYLWDSSLNKYAIF